jgi:outer membrane receptor protein involved in Fe transport
VLPFSFAKLEFGQFDHWRFVVGDSQPLGQGMLLYAIETHSYNGPWDVPEHLRQFKAFVKFTEGDECGGCALSFAAYNGVYTSQEPIPLRAVTSGLIGRFGSLDPTDGGITSRFMLNGQFWRKWDDNSLTTGNAYVTYYSLNTFENETFFLDDPDLGDQIQEKEHRWYTGLNLAHEIPCELLGCKSKHTFGLQLRQDWIPVNDHVGTSARILVDPLSVNNVSQFSGGLFYKNETQWCEKVRTVAGLRGDLYHFDVDAKITPENSGEKWDSILSPKGGIIFGPCADTELYLNAGMSFHSNDAKGVFTVVESGTDEPLTPVPGLIQSRGAEVGVRTKLIPNLTSTVALWHLDLESELIFRGDEGATEPLPASRRHGVEVTNYYQLSDWLSIYADYSHSTARFSEFNPAGQFVPGAPETVFGGGVAAKACNGLYTNWNIRYLGPRALIEDNSARSQSTTVVNMETGWDKPNFRLAVVLLNVLNSHDHDIDYFFASRLPGEPLSGVPDIHFRPLEPFALRVYAMYKW